MCVHTIHIFLETAAGRRADLRFAWICRIASRLHIAGRNGILKSCLTILLQKENLIAHTQYFDQKSLDSASNFSRQNAKGSIFLLSTVQILQNMHYLLDLIFSR
jgi:hypothetical protein